MHDNYDTANISALTTTHVVQPGETLFLIAQRNGISLAELIAANQQAADLSDVLPGLVLNIPSRESLTYLFGGNTTIYTSAIDITHGSIKTVCPDYFDIDKNGNLQITLANKIDPIFIKEMQRSP